MRKSLPIITLGVICLITPPLAAQTSFTDREVAFFEGDVTEILQETCFECHGGEDKLEGGFDMTTRGRILRGGDLGLAIDVDNLDKSLLLEKINSKDKDHRMPPDAPLMQFDIDVLTEWVMMGLPWTDSEEMEAADAPPLEAKISDEDKNFWAYQPVRRPEIPEVSDRAWQSNPIDALVFARLENAGLVPSAPADRIALIRRAYFDLTGLPPTPEEIRAFTNDKNPDAFESVIDHLLASPHYGEKWGRHWLDLVRYADSNGFERDSDKPYMWRYRDYVIDSFNQDKPYSQFVKEQLAGDENDNPSADELIATGFYRLGQWDDEPADPLLGKYDDLADLIDTTSKTFLGMTMGCARCHTHKIDPIPHEDYYRFLSFFHNITPIKRIKGNGILRNIMNEEEKKDFENRKAEHAAVEAAKLTEYYENFETFKAAAHEKKPELLEGKKIIFSDLEEVSYRFYRNDWKSLPHFDDVKPETTGTLTHNYISLSPASREDAIGFVFEGKIRVPEKGDYRFYLTATDGARLKFGRDTVVEAVGKGQSKEKGIVELKKGLQPFRLEYINSTGKPSLKLAWSGPSFGERPLSIAGKKNAPDLKVVTALITKHGKDLLGDEWADKYKKTGEELTRIRETVVDGKYAATVGEEGSAFPDTFLQIRGSPHAPGKPVTPGFPSVLSPPEVEMPERAKGDRTTGLRTILADWLVSESNPLTARVMVNRIWQHHFGRGIVRSTSNFGKAGTDPTHPELLDWLADEFMKNGWEMKSLHKKIMMSRTYQQSSGAREMELAKDPNNHLFWRYDMRRLGAEEVRDAILAVSGDLNRKMRGPGIYTVLPPEVIATSSKKSVIFSSGMWGESTAEDAARRSVYIHIKRSLQPPILTDFDFADTDATCPVRFDTTQPGQALHLLNSDFTHAQADKLNERLKRETNGTPDERIRKAFELTTGREATTEEIERSKLFLSEMRNELGLDEEKAWDRFALLVFNLNEFIFLD
jgi:hypothetical protein